MISLPNSVGLYVVQMGPNMDVCLNGHFPSFWEGNARVLLFILHFQIESFPSRLCPSARALAAAVLVIPVPKEAITTSVETHVATDHAIILGQVPR